MAASSSVEGRFFLAGESHLAVCFRSTPIPRNAVQLAERGGQRFIKYTHHDTFLCGKRRASTRSGLSLTCRLARRSTRCFSLYIELLWFHHPITLDRCFSVTLFEVQVDSVSVHLEHLHRIQIDA